MIFYSIAFFAVPCSIVIRYDRRYCDLYACVTTNRILSLWDSIGNYIVPAFLTILFSVALFARVLYKRYRVRQRIEWKNYRKMAMQLLPISILYIFLQFPPIFLYAAYSAGLSTPNEVYSYYSDALFFTYWVILFTPFACAVSLPDIRMKCQNVLFFWQRRRRIF